MSTPDPAGWPDGFTTRTVESDGVSLTVHAGGSPDGPPLLLLHGSPETSLMWRRVAHALAGRFALVVPDLRGYGRSTSPADTPDHAGSSKRAMAADAVAVMAAHGHDSFLVAGHDRGGRVAHRLALDAPDRVRALCVIDIAPTLDMIEATDAAFATAYWHWFHLVQPAPLPETMIGGAPLAWLHASLGGLGSGGLGHLGPDALAEYERCLTPDTVHAICEDYRASAGIDLDHDRADRAGGVRIACDLHVLWARRCVVHRLFDPLALWQAQCSGTVTGAVLDGGHFLPEELPGATAEALAGFFASAGTPAGTR